MRGDWEGQPEIGRHDTVFRYSFSSGNWQTILISFCSAIGLPELGTLSVAIECESWIFALHAHVHMVIARHAGDSLGNPKPVAKQSRLGRMLLSASKMNRPTSPRPSISRTADVVAASKEETLIKVIDATFPRRWRIS